MRNFIIFFEEKEGTSPLIRLLTNFDQIAVVHLVGQGPSSEPFDRHNCGRMSMRELAQCFDLIFGDQPLDMHRLNAIYTRKAVAPLAIIDKSRAVGFKMRFRPPNAIEGVRLSVRNAVSEALRKKGSNRSFRGTMIELMKKHDVTVFLAVRQDVFRWALSKYHGDGTGKPGHIQFRLAKGLINRSDIGSIYVDPNRFEKVLRACEDSHVDKRRLMEEMQLAGVRVHPLVYEDFLADKKTYFTHLLGALDLDLPDDEVEGALAKGAYFEKVHSHDISQFVENHEEVTERFGERYVSW